MPISLIIIDINMPVKDGLTAMQEIKDYYAQLDRPSVVNAKEFVFEPLFIVMSSKHTPMFKQLVCDKGASNFFANPLQ